MWVRGLMMAGLLWCATTSAETVEQCNGQLQQGAYKDAEAVGRALVAADAHNFEARYCLTRALYESRQTAEALTQSLVAEVLATDAGSQLRIYQLQGLIYNRQGENTKAAAAFNKAVDMSRQAKDKHGEAMALANLAGVQQDNGDLAGAVSNYELAASLRDEEPGKAQLLNNLALAYSAQGNHAKAAETLRHAVTLDAQGDSTYRRAMHSLNLGNELRLLKQYDDADALLEDGAVLIRTSDDLYWEAVANQYLGWLNRDQGHLDMALRYLKMSALVYRKAGETAEAAKVDAEIDHLKQ